MEKIKYVIRYNRKKKLNKNGLAPIQIECYLNGKRKFFDTKIRIKPDQWNEKDKVIKTEKHNNAIQLNRHIKKFIDELESYELKYLNNNEVFTLNMLDDVFTTNKIQTFNEFMRIEIEKSTLSRSTIQTHLTTLKRLNEYNPQILFKDVNFELLHDLKRHFETLKINSNGKKTLSHNTIWKYFKNIKVYVNLAINLDFMPLEQYPFRKFSFPQRAGKKIFLTPNEIESFINCDVPESLQYIKNLFLFSVYTGLRFSDVMSLKITDIVIKDNTDWIIKKMQKTNEIVRIPVSYMFNGEPLKIINKYRQLDSFLIFPQLTNQYVNRELKNIVLLTDINKNVTFHTARHTTATYLLYKNAPITTVQSILGHKKLSTTQIYAEVIDKTIENDIKAVNF